MRLLFSFTLLALALPVFADDSKLASRPKQRLEAIQAEQKSAEEAFWKANNALPDTPEGEKKSADLWQEFDKSQAARFLAAVELAKFNADSEVGLQALEWVLLIPRSYYQPAGKLALEQATAKYAADPKIGKLIATLGYFPPHEKADAFEAAFKLIRTVADKSPDRTARGQAEIALAWQATKNFAEAEYKKSPDLEKLAGEAEKAFEKVLDKYGDCYCLRGEGKKSLGEEAKQELFELRHLRIGKVAPDIVGKDLDGAEFKLSDSKGKIRLVVYWASWCGPCMAMVPHEKKLANRMKDRPFVLIGVNGDKDQAKAKKVTTEQEMNWRSFWDGPMGYNGPLSKAWNVRRWPTIYLLDCEGVIRFKDPTPEELDTIVDQLVEELEKKAKERK